MEALHPLVQGAEPLDEDVDVSAGLGGAGLDRAAQACLHGLDLPAQGAPAEAIGARTESPRQLGAGADRKAYRLAAGLAAGFGALGFSPSLRSPFTSSMNWEMSLN